MLQNAKRGSLRASDAFVQSAALYAVSKIIIVSLAILVFDRIFGQSYFKYVDFDLYSICNIRSPNGFFSAVNCALGIEAITEPQAVLLGLLITTGRDVGYLFVGRRLLSGRGLMLFALCLGLHPYLAAYHAKFATTNFAALAFFIYFWALYSGRRVGVGLHIVGVIFTGLRNGLAPVFILFNGVQLIGDIRKARWAHVILGALSITAIVAVTQLPQYSYAGGFMRSAAGYPLSWQNIIAWVGHDSPVVNYIVAAPLLFFSHLVLLLGFRERGFTDFPDAFLPLNPINIAQIVIFSTMAIVHFIGIIRFYRFFGRQDKRYLIFLIYVFPTFLLVGHLRYFLPFIPFALLGIAFMYDEWRKRRGALTDLAPASA